MISKSAGAVLAIGLLFAVPVAGQGMCNTLPAEECPVCCMIEFEPDEPAWQACLETCPDEPIDVECPPDQAGDECQNNCDCVGSLNGGRCAEHPVCDNTCDLRCVNRNARVEFQEGAFGSCEFICPTTRRPGIGNNAQRFFDRLPDHCKGGTDACDNPDAVPITPAGQPQLPNESCGFYLRLRQCFSDCGPCEKNRLEGYYQICSNIRRLANGERIGGLGGFYNQCPASNSFQEYADGMMFCLQAKISAENADRCLSCNVLVSGLPDIDIESGIIGAHTECNDVNDFCDLASDPGGVPLRCFGASLGRAWGSILGHQSPIGALQPVGVCHLVSQLLACAQGDPVNLLNWQTQICQGYVDGCMTQQGLGDLFPDCVLPGGVRCRDFLRRRLCEATCPIVPAAALIGLLNLGPRGALAFERACNSLLTGGLFIFGIPIFPGLGDLGLPGTGTGRDPCLTY